MPETRRRPIVALEISPLSERFHTGIANFTKAVAREILLDTSVDARFFMVRQAVPRHLVERIVTMDGADILWWTVGRTTTPLDLGDALDRPAIAIYPGAKRHPRLFPIEVQVIYDLTTVITPQFHTEQAVTWWQERILSDLFTSDLIVTISESTRIDVRTYFPQAQHIPCVVAPLAPCTADVPSIADDRQVEPYVLVLGTLEPRKNVEFVFQCLAENPAILAAAVFVFVGRWGWGPSAQELVNHYNLQAARDQRRIRFVGFVVDSVRDQLVAAARCVIYPSRYEGFGLPVLEALSLGTPVITGYGSSLPEAGGTAATYCDTRSAEDLAGALDLVLRDDAGSPEARAKRRAWAASFSWVSTYQRIRDAAFELAF